MHVIISRNERDLKKILKKYKNFDYIYHGEKNSSASAMLASGGSRELFLNTVLDASHKEVFVKEYIDLIGKLGRRYNSLTWYSTFVSSKNKFMSRLLPNLFLYLSIIRILEQRKQNHLVLINLPEEIIPSIERYCHQNSTTFIQYKGRLCTLLNPVKNSFIAILCRFLFIFRMWGKIFVSKIYFSSRVRQKIIQTAPYYVVRSWFYERSIVNNEYKDSFFGSLPDYLARKNNVLILAGVMGNYHTIVKKIADEKNHLIVPQEFFLSFLDPLRTLMAMRKNRIIISEKITCCDLDVTDIVTKEVEKNFRRNAFYQYIYYFITCRLSQTAKIATFTTTYENNPWERVCFKTLKECSSDTKIIGYQHAALSESSLNMVLSDYEKDNIPMPDRVVTVGEVTRDFLIRKGNYDPKKVRTGCGLRFPHLFTLDPKERIRNNTILVTPEGVISESVTLGNFVYSALHNSDMLRIVLRPHPALPYRKFKKFLKFDPAKSRIFFISSNDSVKKDLDITDIVIYRGSTLSLEALKMGIPVIYVALSDIIRVDPLFDCTDLKWVARTEKELVDSITMIYGMSSSEYERKHRAAQGFIARYIMEITDERLREFII